MKLAIVGCGQLAQMMAHAANKLGVETRFLAEQNEGTGCVDELGDVVRLPAGDLDVASLYQQLGSPDVVTVEREDVSIDLLKQFQPFCAVHPNPESVAKTQHRALEKKSLSDLDIPVAPYCVSHSFSDAQEAISTLGLPVFIKSCEQGYDGKNQWRITHIDQLSAIEPVLNSIECVIEGAVNYRAEVSLIVARSAKQQVVFYPPTENVHHKGILLTSLAPSLSSGEQNKLIGEGFLQRIIEAWDYVGILAMECFLTDDGLIVNELAPRVHNSGHWTMDSEASSQFENHIRAIFGMELGKTTIKNYYGMFNLLGTDTKPATAISCKSSHHRYNKASRPGRKVGHLNLQSGDVSELELDLKNLTDAYVGASVVNQT